MSQTKLTLVSHMLCPFVQRASIALAEKGIPFERVNIHLSDKPQWFLDISPLGKVPLLRVLREDGTEAVLFESNVICEYLEETQPGVKLHPADAIERAQHRGWMEFGSAVISDLWPFQVAKDESSADMLATPLMTKLHRIEQATSKTGPFFAGDAISYVDAVFAPIFRQIDVLKRRTGKDLLEGLPQLARWSTVLLARPSVVSAVTPDYDARFLDMLRERDAYLTKQAA